MKSGYFLFAFLSLLALSTPVALARRSEHPDHTKKDCCTLAASQCLFRFVSRPLAPSFPISSTPTDEEFTPLIAFRRPPFAGATLGVANSNVPAEVVVGTVEGTCAAVRVGELPGVPGVQNFTPFQFRTHPLGDGTTIAHETFQGNLEFADDLCVRVFLTSYQVRNAAGDVVQNVNGAGRNSCVVFRTEVE